MDAIEIKFNSALSASNEPKQFNHEINNIDNLLLELNSLIIEKQNEHVLSEKEKNHIKKILDLIGKTQKINKNKMDFFESLNKYFYDNVNK